MIQNSNEFPFEKRWPEAQSGFSWTSFACGLKPKCLLLPLVSAAPLSRQRRSWRPPAPLGSQLLLSLCELCRCLCVPVHGTASSASFCHLSLLHPIRHRQHAQALSSLLPSQPVRGGSAGSVGAGVGTSNGTELIPLLCLSFFPTLWALGSKSSGSNRSNSENSRRALGREKDRKSAGSGSESDHTACSGGTSTARRERPVSQLSHRSHVSATHSERSHHSHHSYGPPGVPPLYNLPKLGSKVYGTTSGPPGGPPVRELSSVPPELTGSRQSFQKAMGNPCEFFVDIMWEEVPSDSALGRAGADRFGAGWEMRSLSDP